MGAFASRSKTAGGRYAAGASPAATAHTQEVKNEYAELKILLVGPHAAGKSAFTHRLLQQRFVQAYTAGTTPRASSTFLSLEAFPRMAVTLWEFPAGWNEPSIAAALAEGVDGMMLFVDAGDRDGLQKAERYLDAARKAVAASRARADPPDGERLQRDGDVSLAVGSEPASARDHQPVRSQGAVFAMLVVNKMDVVQGTGHGPRPARAASSTAAAGDAATTHEPVDGMITTARTPRHQDDGVAHLASPFSPSTIAASDPVAGARGRASRSASDFGDTASVGGESSYSGVVAAVHSSELSPRGDVEYTFVVDEQGLPVVTRHERQPSHHDIRESAIAWARAHGMDTIAMISVKEDAGVDDALKRVVRGVVTVRQRCGDARFAAPAPQPEPARPAPFEPWSALCASKASVASAEIPTSVPPAMRAPETGPIIIPRPQVPGSRKARGKRMVPRATMNSQEKVGAPAPAPEAFVGLAALESRR